MTDVDEAVVCPTCGDSEEMTDGAAGSRGSSSSSTTARGAAGKVSRDRLMGTVEGMTENQNTEPVEPATTEVEVETPAKDTTTTEVAATPETEAATPAE